MKIKFIGLFLLGLLAGGLSLRAATTVDAGPNQSIVLVGPSTFTFLQGSVVTTSTMTFATWSQISPPTPLAQIASSTSTTTRVTFFSTGTFVFQLSVFDFITTTTDTVTINVLLNQAPIVNAGVDQSITTTTLTLNGSISDDTLLQPFTTGWMLVSGPTTVQFNSTSTLQPQVTFSSSGVYVFRLSSYDGQFTSSDTVSITVNLPPPNQLPVVDAGSDQTITTTTITLNGSISDDGLLQPFTTSWTLVSGPATVQFNSTSTLQPQVTFSSSGVYVFRLSSYDGQFTSSDTVSITVNLPLPNQPPVVDAGVDQMATNTSFTLVGNVSDDGLLNPFTLLWRPISDPGTPPQILSPTTAQTLIQVTQSGSYTFELSADDGEFTVTDQVTVMVTLPLPAALSRDNVILHQSRNVVENGQPALIRFRLNSSGVTTMTIFGRGGIVVARPIDHEFLNAGDHQRSWDGAGVGDGTYKIRLEQDDRIVKTFYIVVNR